MKAVVFDAPGKVSVQERPIPHIQEETDIVVAVTYTALCGSYVSPKPKSSTCANDYLALKRELHVFRGHQPSPTGFIMGHEFTGIVKEVGKDVKTVKVGDKIVSPFTVSWYALLTNLSCDQITNKLSF